MLLDAVNFIIRGTVTTILVTLVALPMGFFLGLLFSLGRVYGGTLLSRILATYSSLMRSVPPIVLLFILYFLMSDIINLSPFWAGSLALGIISSSYQMEILRGAFQSIGSSQMVAARSIGMSKIKAIRYIIAPQALRIAIPSWSNEVAIVIKDTSLVYALGVPEILRRAQFFSARTYEPFIAYSTAALIYFFLILGVNRLLQIFEKNLRIPAVD